MTLNKRGCHFPHKKTINQKNLSQCCFDLHKKKRLKRILHDNALLVSRTIQIMLEKMTDETQLIHLWAVLQGETP